MSMKPLGSYHWRDGYCSKRCSETDIDYDEEEEYPLLDPTDPDGTRLICETRDEVDAMLDAAEIDPRLPKMIYLKNQGLSLRAIGRKMLPSVSAQTCYRLLDRVTCKDLP